MKNLMLVALLFLMGCPEKPMDLLGIRTAVTTRTGRYDLIGESGSPPTPDFAIDSGCDAFIREAQLMLADRLPWLLAEDRYEAAIAVGDFSLPIPRLRNVRRVEFIEDAVEKEWAPLVGKRMAWMREHYFYPFPGNTKGAPRWWARDKIPYYGNLLDYPVIHDTEAGLLVAGEHVANHDFSEYDNLIGAAAQVDSSLLSYTAVCPNALAAGTYALSVMIGIANDGTETGYFALTGISPSGAPTVLWSSSGNTMLDGEEVRKATVFTTTVEMTDVTFFATSSDVIGSGHSWDLSSLELYETKDIVNVASLAVADWTLGSNWAVDGATLKATAAINAVNLLFAEFAEDLIAHHRYLISITATVTIGTCGFAIAPASVPQLDSPPTNASLGVVSRTGITQAVFTATDREVAGVGLGLWPYLFGSTFTGVISSVTIKDITPILADWTQVTGDWSYDGVKLIATAASTAVLQPAANLLHPLLLGHEYELSITLDLDSGVLDVGLDQGAFTAKLNITGTGGVSATKTARFYLNVDSPPATIALLGTAFTGTVTHVSITDVSNGWVYDDTILPATPRLNLKDGKNAFLPLRYADNSMIVRGTVLKWSVMAKLNVGSVLYCAPVGSGTSPTPQTYAYDATQDYERLLEFEWTVDGDYDPDTLYLGFSVVGGDAYILTPAFTVEGWGILNPRRTDGIVFLPPADKAYIIGVDCYLFPEEYSGDTDSDWLSENRPELLILATCYRMEIARRNTAGCNDYLGQLNVLLVEEDKDHADREQKMFEDKSGLLQVREWEDY